MNKKIISGELSDLLHKNMEFSRQNANLKYLLCFIYCTFHQTDE